MDGKEEGRQLDSKKSKKNLNIQKFPRSPETQYENFSTQHTRFSVYIRYSV